jgi:very-short-patch-repair endonuclease
MNEAESAVMILAEQQYGVIARRQAIELHMSQSAIERRVIAGRWQPLAAGVFRVVGAARSPHQYLTAASLVHTHGAVSHASGAFLLRLDGFAELSSIDISLPRTRDAAIRRFEVVDDERRAAWIVRFHRPARLDPVDQVIVDGITCTSAARTVIDIAATVRGERLENAFESARRFGLVSYEQLARRASDLCGRGRAGTREIRELLANAGDGVRALESRLEVRVWRLWRTTSLPRPTRQQWVDLPDGTSARIDFALTDIFVAVEAEGFEFHGNRLRWKRDRRRVAQLEALGWRLVVVTWDDVTNHRAETIDRIRATIAERARQKLA